MYHETIDATFIPASKDSARSDMFTTSSAKAFAPMKYAEGFESKHDVSRSSFQELVSAKSGEFCASSRKAKLCMRELENLYIRGD